MQKWSGRLKNIAALCTPRRAEARWRICVDSNLMKIMIFDKFWWNYLNNYSYRINYSRNYLGKKKIIVTLVRTTEAPPPRVNLSPKPKPQRKARDGPCSLRGNPKTNNQTIKLKFNQKIKKQSNLIRHPSFLIKKQSNSIIWTPGGSPPGWKLSNLIVF